jgi:hypothetical protein
MKPANASTTAAVFDTNYSSPAIAPAKNPFNQRNLLDAVYWMPQMSQLTKFVKAVPGFCARWVKIYQIFTVLKPSQLRLCTRMQPIHTNWQMGPHLQGGGGVRTRPF